MSRLAQIQAELIALDKRRGELLLEKQALLQAPDKPSGALSPTEKISLFLSLFACRQDVYPKLWENP